MSVDMPPGSLNLESQLLSIMDVLVKAAVGEISQLFSENSASLRLHLSQSLRENEALRTRMKVMRSELFSLRLQTRNNRPSSRFSPLRGNLPKTRVKSQVLIRPPEAQKTAEEAVSISLQSEKKSSSPLKCAEVETPDIILIKDEDDTGGCGPVGGQEDMGHLNTEDPVDTGAQDLESSCLTGNHNELRIVSVCGGAEGTLQDGSDTLFTASELQAFSSLSSDHNMTHESLLNFNPAASDRAPIRGIQDNIGLSRNSQLERNHSTPMASTSLNPAMDTAGGGADGHMGHPSQVNQFPQQQNAFLYTSNKSLECSFCGECFLSREELIAHRATHTGETPVPCSFCGKTFVNKTTLNIHMRIHTGEKPYACTQCGKRFTQNGSLKIHLRTHSGEKPYTCNQCPASFNNPSNLRRHMITHTTNDML